ncbi:MAG: hypothetical protein IPI78_18745 [Chitinophagaceae bacterium]|nr:hypothetical protein [Chitinophagaceae bacterium]
MPTADNAVRNGNRAEGVQLGSRFRQAKKLHLMLNFKNEIISSKEGRYKLTMKQLTPVRLMKNDFSKKWMKQKKEQR